MRDRLRCRARGQRSLEGGGSKKRCFQNYSITQRVKHEPLQLEAHVGLLGADME